MPLSDDPPQWMVERFDFDGRLVVVSVRDPGDEAIAPCFRVDWSEKPTRLTLEQIGEFDRLKAQAVVRLRRRLMAARETT